MSKAVIRDAIVVLAGAIGSLVQGAPEGVPAALRKVADDLDRTRQATIPGVDNIPPPKSEALKVVAVDLFGYWQRTSGHHRAKMTEERIRAIRSRLRDGYSPADIRKAIEGAKESPFHQGENERGQRYDDITLICRNGTTLERFMSYAGHAPAGPNETPGAERRAQELERLEEQAQRAMAEDRIDEYNEIQRRIRALS